jgi:hypothetical protein
MNSLKTQSLHSVFTILQFNAYIVVGSYGEGDVVPLPSELLCSEKGRHIIVFPARFSRGAIEESPPF